MKIMESDIRYASAHMAEEYVERREALIIRPRGNSPVGNGAMRETEEEGREKPVSPAAQVSLSPAAQRRSQPVRAVEELAAAKGTEEDLKLLLLKALLGKFFGRRLNGDGLKRPENGNTATPAVASGPELLYESRKIYHEAESTSFAAQGIVRTADGQEIAIAVELNMSRSFTSIIEVSAATAFKDPLVIHFDGFAAALSQTEFTFAIVADGVKEEMAFAGQGSGFLSLDKNDNNVIDDGRELFGALSGDGFADLAAYDEDGNGWIDESDSVFSRLRIWIKTPEGEDRLFSLGEKGIGALFLGRAATPFALKDEENALQGQVRSTGIFLKEDGTAGVMQQLDLVA